jgi:ketosteroid isomerase-like protein
MAEDQTMKLFAALLRSSMGDCLVPEAVSFLDMLAEDAVMEFPFAPPGLPRHLDGKAAIRKHVENLGGMIQVERFSSLAVHRTSSGFVLEFTCSGIGTQTGRAYNQEYVSVITLREGRIVRYRDYWNPLHVLNAMKPADGAEKELA